MFKKIRLIYEIIRMLQQLWEKIKTFKPEEHKPEPEVNRLHELEKEQQERRERIETEQKERDEKLDEAEAKIIPSDFVEPKTKEELDSRIDDLFEKLLEDMKEQNEGTS